jgi:hypothetical protein
MKKIFISYSHKDAKDKDRLMTHLGALEKQGQIALWDDALRRTGFATPSACSCRIIGISALVFC